MNYLPSYIRFFAFLLLGLGSALVSPAVAATHQHLPPIKVLNIGPALDFYDTGRDGCGEQDVPDEAARAFRDKSGLIHFFASNSINRALLGYHFSTLAHSCNVVFKGALNTDPSDYNDNGWLTAFYSTGDTVVAFIHNEFHGSERSDLCPSIGGANCIEISITEAVSKDGGYHFTRYPGDKGLVAALPHKFQPKRGTFIGDMNPSNIIKKSNFFYVLISAIDPYEEGHSGVCLLRTKTLSDATSWRAWNGHDFSTTFVDPYHTLIADAPEHACLPIESNNLFFSLGSITWSAVRHSYVLVTRFQTWDKPRPGLTPGAYLFESYDLIHWSPPILLLSDAQAGGVAQLYPSFIDPDSVDENFSTTGDEPILYTKISTRGQGYKSWKLIARQVKLGS